LEITSCDIQSVRENGAAPLMVANKEIAARVEKLERRHDRTAWVNE
jgi:hypothetical protein